MCREFQDAFTTMAKLHVARRRCCCGAANLVSEGWEQLSMGLRTALYSLNAREAFPCMRDDASSYCMAYSYQLFRLVEGLALGRWIGSRRRANSEGFCTGLLRHWTGWHVHRKITDQWSKQAPPIWHHHHQIAYMENTTLVWSLSRGIPYS